MPVKPVTRKSNAIPRQKKNSQAWNDFSSPFKRGLNSVSYVITHFGRFGQDVFSILLGLFSILSMLALLGITSGSLLSPWAEFLQQWFGWGAFLLVLSCGYLGIVGLRRKKAQPGSFFWKVVVVEGLLFSLMAFLSALSGYDLDKAESGNFGGLLGWGLSDLFRSFFGEFLGGVAWFAVFIIFLVFASNQIKSRTTTSNPSSSDLESKKMRRVQITNLAEQNVVDQTSSAFIPDEDISRSTSNPRHTLISEKPSSTITPTKNPFSTPSKPLQNLGSMPVHNKRTGEMISTKPASNMKRDAVLPPLNILMDEQVIRMDESAINQAASILEKTLMDFGVPARVIGYRIGPTVTQFAVEPGYVEKPGVDGIPSKQKVRVNQISTLSRDLALALSSTTIRIEAPVPGRSYVGIEIPNVRTVTVRLKPILESEKFTKIGTPLAIALGRDVSGQPLAADLGRMPHMLIAGTTGSGKSVCIASIAACLAMNNSPEDLRMVMIDPKMVELVRFNGLPHILGKVETELDRIQSVLRWVIAEMDHRYKLFSELNCRDLAAYNRKMEKRGKSSFPRIVVIIDELADLMMTAPTQTEPALVRLAQLARATGIHLIVATQRPSTDVVTGLIKANFPARLAFAVASNMDSRVILDTPGAESLLGRGDMLFLNPEVGSPVRAQGVMISDEEIDKIIAHWQKELPESMENSAPWEMIVEEEASGSDDLIQQAIDVIKQTRKASASLLQRRLRIGYPRAASLIDELEDMGIIGPPMGGNRERELLVESDDDLDTIE